MAKTYSIVLEFRSKKEAEQVIDEISNLSETFWNDIKEFDYAKSW